MKMEVLPAQNHHIQQEQQQQQQQQQQRPEQRSMQSTSYSVDINNLTANVQDFAEPLSRSSNTLDNNPLEYGNVMDLPSLELAHPFNRNHGSDSTILFPHDNKDNAERLSGSHFVGINAASGSSSVTAFTTTSLQSRVYDVGTAGAAAAVAAAAVTTMTPSPASSNLSTPTEATENYGLEDNDLTIHNNIDTVTVGELSQRLQNELRKAKHQHLLTCTEVSLPCHLMQSIAAEMIRTSKREPCGVRGSAIFINFEDVTGSTRRIASFKVDPDTVSTFELYLTLKQDEQVNGWTSLLPQFLKNLTRRHTILISPHFTLHKNKIYACS